MPERTCLTTRPLGLSLVVAWLGVWHATHGFVEGGSLTAAWPSVMVASVMSFNLSSVVLVSAVVLTAVTLRAL